MVNLRLIGLFVILAVLIIVLGWFSCNQYNKSKALTKQVQDTAFNAAVNDRIYEVDDKTSRILTLTTENNELFTKIKFKDATIDSLQKVVKQYNGKLQAGSSVTRTNISTVVTKTTPTVNKLEDIVRVWVNKNGAMVDTTQHHYDHMDNRLSTYDSSHKATYPTYTTNYSDKWVEYTIAATFDSTKLDLKVNNEYSTVVGYDKGKAFADVINYNPYSKTTSTRTYQVQIPKPKKFGLGFSFGGALVGGKIQPYIGAGLNYNALRF